jgi:hypothetical protein
VAVTTMVVAFGAAIALWDKNKSASPNPMDRTRQIRSTPFQEFFCFVAIAVNFFLVFEGW